MRLASAGLGLAIGSFLSYLLSSLLPSLVVAAPAMSAPAPALAAPAPVGPAARPLAAKVPAELAREMAESIIAVNKALGLESWPLHGASPCVERGGEGTTAKDVTVADTRRCSEAALAAGFPQLGKSYALAVTMSEVGPITVVALGLGELAHFGAYSCDPGRKCLPTKIDPGTKWGKRLVERQKKACSEAQTVWLPASARACPAL